MQLTNRWWSVVVVAVGGSVGVVLVPCCHFNNKICIREVLFTQPLRDFYFSVLPCGT